MSVNTFNDLLPFMMPELPGCITPMVKQALQRGVRQFCIDTEYWWEELNPINLVADQDEYTIHSTWDAEIRRIKELRINDAENIAAGNDGQVQDTSYYEFFPPSTLKLDDAIKPADNVTNGLEVEVRIVPSITATTVDPTLLVSWTDAIVGWAMYYLMSMERKKWSSKERALFYMAQYQKGRSQAKAEKVRERREGVTCLSA